MRSTTAPKVTTYRESAKLTRRRVREFALRCATAPTSRSRTTRAPFTDNPMHEAASCALGEFSCCASDATLAVRIEPRDAAYGVGERADDGRLGAPGNAWKAAPWYTAEQCVPTSDQALCALYRASGLERRAHEVLNSDLLHRGFG